MKIFGFEYKTESERKQERFEEIMKGTGTLENKITTLYWQGFGESAELMKQTALSLGINPRCSKPLTECSEGLAHLC